MIAIMILGLGMVMVATVFPVSLDMTRGTVQLNISQSAADAAVGTLALRLPRAKNLSPLIKAMGNYPYFPRLAIGDMQLRELTAPMADLDADDSAVSNPYPWNGWPVASPPPPALPPLTMGLNRIRIYTEQSFWEAEAAGANQPLLSFAVAMQNITPDLIVAAEAVPVLTTFGPYLPRVSVADRVYPPVDLLYDYNTTPATPLAAQMLAQVAERRYGWSAVHFRDLNDATNKTFFTRIVVLYRGNLSARFAQQDAAAGFLLAPPVPAATNLTDTLFPQPWMVTFNDIDGGSGTARCTLDVARLIPDGGYFMLAKNMLVPGGGGYVSCVGAFTKVLSRTLDLTNGIATLQFKPADLGFTVQVVNDLAVTPPDPLAVWVYPPAIQSAPATGRTLSNVQWETSSPVIDIVPKKVITG